MPRPVPVRGVIEGFYGPPWSADARLSVIEFVAERGMNAYVYAPKDDPKHRARWRDAYDAGEMARFGDTAERCDKLGVRFGWAVSPGLDIDYGSDAERATLVAKLAPLLDVGVGWAVLALDDIPLRSGLASAQGELCAWLLDAMRASRADVSLTLVPTEYLGTEPSRYLAELATALPPEVDVMWTGLTVCSPTITAAQAQARAAALSGRAPLVWDNYPVNDGPMDRGLHLGPYRGREPELTDAVAGLLCNPMVQPHASKVALATAADFLADPTGYDADASWAAAIAAVGGEHAEAMGALARACADGPLEPPGELLVHRLVDAIEAARGGSDSDAPVTALRDELEALRTTARAWDDAADDPLGAELAPWRAQASREAAAGLAALDLMEHSGHAAPADAEALMLAAFGLLFAWAGARRGDRRVLGPRFAIYPSVVQLASGRPGLDVAQAVIEDRNATDRLCRLALAVYEAWCATESAPGSA